MEKPGTFDVVDNDNEINRDIIKTHLYYLQNINILNDRERGYFYNQYFPYLKEYCQASLELVEFTGDNTNPETPRLDVEEFRFDKHLNVDAVTLRTLPKEVNGVYIAKSHEDFTRGVSWRLTAIRRWTVDLLRGVVYFPEPVNVPKIQEYLDITDFYSVFVEYVAINKRAANVYQTGEDGEK